MIGKPKYKENDVVIFTIDGEILTGYVYIVDAYGTFEQNEEPSYDIMVEKPVHCLYKHIRESRLIDGRSN